MITLEHVRLLESRVEKAISYIDKLKAENSQLKNNISGYENKIQELEALVRNFQSEQGRIEEGIIHALEKLNKFEDIIIQNSSNQASRVAPIAVDPAPSLSNNTIMQDENTEDHASDASFWEETTKAETVVATQSGELDIF